MSRHWRTPHRRQPTPFGMMRPLTPPRRLGALDTAAVILGLAGICWFVVAALRSLAGA